MASFWDDLQIVELILGDISQVAAGGVVSGTKQIGGTTYNVQVQVLTNGPSGTPFQVISGSFWSILTTVFGDLTALAAGAPIQIADKVGNTWYGLTLAAVPAHADATASPDRTLDPSL